MLKRGLVLGVALILLNISVSAIWWNPSDWGQVQLSEDTGCLDSQVILKISSDTNAHGEFYNNANYSKKICYNQIFSSVFAGTNPHECIQLNSGNNAVIRLSGETNAHTAVKGEFYPASGRVCYGDLMCRNTRESCNSTNGEKLVLSLSGETNAHISSGNDYPVKICCKKSGIEICTDGVDNDGDNLIDCKDSDCVANPICAHPCNASCSDVICHPRTEICTNSVDDDCDGKIDSTDDDCESGSCEIGERLCADGICNITCTTELQCNNNYVCERTESCMCADCHGETDRCKQGLICDYKTNTCQNPPLNWENLEIQIIKPENKQRFSLNEVISFEQKIPNADKLKKNANISWYFGDGLSEEKSSCLNPNSNCNTTHKYYPKSGTMIIKASAKEIGGRGVANDFATIFVCKEGLNLFPYITEPEPGSKLDKNVKFDASESHIAECNSTCNAPAGKQCVNCGEYKCYIFPKEGIGEDYELWLNWTIKDEENKLVEERIGTWSEDYNDVVKFHKFFDEEGRYYASLRIGYEEI